MFVAPKLETPVRSSAALEEGTAMSVNVRELVPLPEILREAGPLGVRMPRVTEEEFPTSSRLPPASVSGVVLPKRPAVLRPPESSSRSSAPALIVMLLAFWRVPPETPFRRRVPLLIVSAPVMVLTPVRASVLVPE